MGNGCVTWVLDHPFGCLCCSGLANFAGAICRKYAVELTGIMQYVANQLKAGKRSVHTHTHMHARMHAQHTHTHTTFHWQRWEGHRVRCVVTYRHLKQVLLCSSLDILLQITQYNLVRADCQNYVSSVQPRGRCWVLVVNP